MRSLVYTLLGLAAFFYSTEVSAKTYFLPDYQESNATRSGGTGRPADTSTVDSTCAKYGLVSSCPAYQLGISPAKPMPSLTCYTKCVCDPSYYPYFSVPATIAGATRCRSPKVLDGEMCRAAHPFDFATECVCPEEYKHASCPTGAICDSLTCDGKYKITSCQTGYKLQNDSCVPNSCSTYGYTTSSSMTNKQCTSVPSANAGGLTGCYNCVCNGVFSYSSCPSTASTCSSCDGKYRIDTCREGYTRELTMLSGVMTYVCTANDCPAGYTAGVTSCANSYDTYSSKGYSGSQICGRCTCTQNDCSDYTLTSVPANAYYSSCTPGCGDNTTKYKITSCKTDYALKNNACSLKTCEDYGSEYHTPPVVGGGTCDNATPRSGLSCLYCCRTLEQLLLGTNICPPLTTCEEDGYRSSIPFGQTCDTVAFVTKTCYTNCTFQDVQMGSCEDGGYLESAPVCSFGKTYDTVTYNQKTCYTSCHTATTCADGGYESSIKDYHKNCTKVTYQGLTCYSGCQQKTCAEGGYYDGREILVNYTAVQFGALTCYIEKPVLGLQ